MENLKGYFTFDGIIMNIFHLIFKEIIHRKLNFLLGLLAIALAVALFTSFFTIGQASKRETVRLMRDIGFNLRIIPKETDVSKFWMTGFSEYTMPEDYVNRFAKYKGISYNHVTAILHKKILWNDKEVILTGVAQKEITPPGVAEKSPMIFSIESGTVHLGSEIAVGHRIKKGGKIVILGKSFVVARVLPESGSEDDIRIYGNLLDVQKLLNMEGKINEIKALECLCFTPGRDPLVALRKELEQVLPEAKVFRIQSIATARESQRLMVDKYFSLILPFMLIVCAAWVGVLAMINVRERRSEIGIMRALGYGSAKIALLFLGKALMIGLIGAILGFGIGTFLALGFGPDIFKVTAKAIKPVYELLGWSLLAAPLFTALSSFIPAMVAVTQDPASTLREE
jgi:putative ABC transport system permease protein